MDDKRYEKVLKEQNDTEIDYSRFDFPANAVVSLFELFSSSEIPAWLDGGWGVDAMAREQTRPHRDIDVVVPIEKRGELEELLVDRGFSIDNGETRLPHRLVVLDMDRLLMVDVHFVDFQPDGSAVWTVPTYDEGADKYTYTYEAQGFEGMGLIDGAVIPCLTLEEQVRCRTTRQYSFDDPDRQRSNGINADLHDLELIKHISGGQI